MYSLQASAKSPIKWEWKYLWSPRRLNPLPVHHHLCPNHHHRFHHQSSSCLFALTSDWYRSSWISIRFAIPAYINNNNPWTEDKLPLFILTKDKREKSKSEVAIPLWMRPQFTPGVNKSRTVAPNICGSSVWNLLDVTLLSPSVLRWLREFQDVCVTQIYNHPKALGHSHQMYLLRC